MRNPILLNRYRKPSIKPPPPPPPWGGLYLFQAYFMRGLIETGGLFNSETMMVSVLHKELEYQVKTLMNKKVGGHAAEDQNQIRTSSW